MTKSNHYITNLLRVFAFVSVVCAIVIQPAMESLGYLDNQNFELVDIDAEKETNDKENQEENVKDEKVELQILNFCQNNYYYLLFKDINNIQISFKNITKDIPSPPPDLA